MGEKSPSFSLIRDHNHRSSVMHVRLSEPMTQLPSSRECDMPVYHISLVMQVDANPSTWLLEHIREALEDDEYVTLKDIHEIVQRDCTLEHHGGH